MIQIPVNTLPRVVLAPMAGITDQPFRTLCRNFGAHSTTSEMVASNPAFRNSTKTRLRLNHTGETGTIIVQIAGADPKILADAARYNVDNGALVIDINMGCPAKKVCNVMAGSALLSNEPLVTEILESVVDAVDIPVTLKIRTGPNPDLRNGVTIAKIAEQSGIKSLAVHGRTRACAYRGEAEYETIRSIKQNVSIPVLANGDISTPRKAFEVLSATGADGIMIGRGALGNPWIFREIEHYLETGQNMSRPDHNQITDTIFQHLMALYDHYGEYMGLRIARKHLRWYFENSLGMLTKEEKIWKQITEADTIESQQRALRIHFETLTEQAA